MGFDVGYISNALNPKMTCQQSHDLGACMIGNSFQVDVISLLLDELLATTDSNYLPRQLGTIFKKGPEAPSGWCPAPQFQPSTQPDHRSQMLVQEFLRVGEKAGSDVRLDVNEPFRIKAWPRSGLRSHLFHWKIVHGYPWRHSAHINVLELQAVLNAMQWRLRKTTGFRKRVLHLVNNQVVASVLSKGRTGSRRLHKALNKLNALCLAGGVYLSIGYINTHDNPSDVPSRWGPMKGKDKHAKKRGKASV